MNKFQIQRVNIKSKAFRGSKKNWLLFYAALIFLGFHTGCSVYDNNYRPVVFAKPVLIDYNRFAIVGFNNYDEQIFMAEYANSIKPVTFVERNQLTKVIDEQELLPGRLDESKRAQLRKILGVEAIVAPGGGIGSFKIIDTATGEIVASVAVKVYGGATFNPPSSEEAIRTAVKALNEKLSGKTSNK